MHDMFMSIPHYLAFEGGTVLTIYNHNKYILYINLFDLITFTIIVNFFVFRLKLVL